MYDGKVLFRMPQYPDMDTVVGNPCTVMEGLHEHTVHAVCLRDTRMCRRKCSSKDLGNRGTEGKRYIPVQQGPSDLTHVPDQTLEEVGPFLQLSNPRGTVTERFIQLTPSSTSPMLV